VEIDYKQITNNSILKDLNKLEDIIISNVRGSSFLEGIELTNEQIKKWITNDNMLI